MFPYKGKGYSGSLEIFFIFLDLCLDRGLSSNVVILRGTTIGANSVVAAGSVVVNDVSPNTVFVQKRVSSEFSRG
jgi:hypothetical protein